MGIFVKDDNEKLNYNNSDSDLINEVYKELSLEFNLPLKTIKKVTKSPFKYLSKYIRNLDKEDESKYPIFTLNLFGVFYIKKSVFIRNRYKEKERHAKLKRHNKKYAKPIKIKL